MIRLAFVAVIAVAIALAFGGYTLVRNTGGDGARDPAPAILQPDEAAETPAAEAAPVAPPDVLFLKDIDLETGDVALVLYGLGPAPLVVTDKAALQAAAPSAALAASAVGASPDLRLAALYRGDVLVGEWPCPVDGCPPLSNPEVADLAGLTDVAQPLAQLEDRFDNYTDYLDALTFVQSDPDFALLDLAGAHPLAQQTPTATLTLPTISRRADAPLDSETHAALLAALLADTLPAGVEVARVAITPLGSPIVVDADNGRAATRGGAEIPFDGVLFYAVTADLTGTADLSDDLLATLSEQTRLTVEWQEDATEFVAALGLACADCYAVRPRGEIAQMAEITQSSPESYVLTYYDLRDPP